MTLEILARMVSNGFSDMQKQNALEHAALRDEIISVRTELHTEVGAIHAELSSIRKELKEINLSLSF